MNVFISYRFSGESLDNLTALLQPIQQTLKAAKIDSYCSLFDQDPADREKKLAPHDYLVKALAQLDSSDLLLVVITSNNVSEGMLLEVGYSLARNIPLLLFIKEGVPNTYLPSLAKKVLTWTDIDDLVTKLKDTDLTAL